jgi:hypothetical protein
MDYCTPHFSKPLGLLTFDDVENYFSSERFETDQLEFKSFGGNLNESYKSISRVACAFLNSKGGLLIWGAPLGVIAAGRNEKIFQGALTPIGEILVKDRVISKISDSITPLPLGIRVKIIENGQQQCVCVFEIDESDYSPHQFDKIYYMRIDGQNKPAPHHYVESLFKKIRYPQLEGYLKFTRVTGDQIYCYISFDVYLINWSPLQNIELLSFRVILDSGVFATNTSNNYFMEGHEWRRESYKNVLHYGEPCRDANVIRVERQLVDRGEMLTVMLSFGAKNSPSKMSEYTLNLGRLRNGGDAERAVVERKENRSYKEIQDQKGMTREVFLEALLGR